MARIPALTPEDLDVAQRDLYQRISRGPRAQGPQHFDLQRPDGSLTGPFNAFLLSPPVGTALQSVGTALRYETGLDARTRETAVLMVAAHWGSAFEQHAHEGAARAAGLRDEDLEAIRAGRHPAYQSSHEEACGRLVRSMLDGDVDDLTWSECAHIAGAPAVFELSALVGYYATLALQLRVFRADDAT